MSPGGISGWIDYALGLPGGTGLRQSAQEYRAKNLTLIALRDESVWDGRVDVHRGVSTHAEAFELYVEHFLAPPKLFLRGRLVVLDKLGAHRPQRIRELIEERGALSSWCFCPPTLRI